MVRFFHTIDGIFVLHSCGVVKKKEVGCSHHTCLISSADDNQMCFVCGGNFTASDRGGFVVVFTYFAVRSVKADAASYLSWDAER